eukprot:gnl/TRDRNA2_/TRDRNA2_168880_c0_seq1.p1 gnl/TRDRNA2_/TRDRNA2_168880_c0~~gnl/TRDRNA2_/TRDRNA2_168880_c0_seq1.p1  ORF type:complete len:593 (-),score=94.17 gnl/TRDRNA2_/TRDRNA2_168880_c0_seq1:182-1894(-)
MFAARFFVFFVALLWIYHNAGVRRWPRIRAAIQNAGAAAEVLSSVYIVFYAFLIIVVLKCSYINSSDSYMRLASRVFSWRPNGPNITDVYAMQHLELPPKLCSAVLNRVCKFETNCLSNGDKCDLDALQWCKEQHADPCDLLELPAWLHWLVMCSPLCVTIAIVISLWHTVKHMRYGRPWQTEELSHEHDMSIQVVSLAPVYGVFMLMAVLRVTELFEGSIHNDNMGTASPSCREELEFGARLGLSEMCWDEFVARMESLYEADLNVADFWEARVLFCFSQLCTGYLETQHQRGVLRNERCLSKRRPTPATKMDIDEKVLLEPLKQMTMIGVYCFVMVDFIRSLYMVCLNMAVSYSPDAGKYISNNVPVETWEQCFTGFTFCVSTIAIYNLITFEEHMKDMLDGFSPRLKFMSAKIIVSLAFIQSILISLFSRLFPDSALQKYPDSYQKQLCYAALMCVEMVPVALLQYVAWSPEQSWYHVSSEEQRWVGEEQFQINSGPEKHLLVTVQKQAMKGFLPFWRSASVKLLSKDAQDPEAAAEPCCELESSDICTTSTSVATIVGGEGKHVKF